jgi:hypothetical protein
MRTRRESPVRPLLHKPRSSVSHSVTVFSSSTPLLLSPNDLRNVTAMRSLQACHLRRAANTVSGRTNVPRVARPIVHRMVALAAGASLFQPTGLHTGLHLTMGAFDRKDGIAGHRRHDVRGLHIQGRKCLKG